MLDLPYFFKMTKKRFEFFLESVIPEHIVLFFCEYKRIQKRGAQLLHPPPRSAPEGHWKRIIKWVMPLTQKMYMLSKRDNIISKHSSPLVNL